MFLTNKHLNRRTILRGVGAALALPVLDAMAPALLRGSAAAPNVRLGFVYVPNGIIASGWTPTG